MNNNRPDIQGLRAISVIAVVVFHASRLLPGGFLGVDIFFVISGFIIAQLAATEIRTTGAFSPTNFLRRRLRRLLPAMAIVVLVTLSFGMLIDTPSRMAEVLPTTALAALAGLVNFHFLWGATDYFQTFRSNPLLHLWSLAVEMQFYILFAVALPAALRVRRALGLSSRYIPWLPAVLAMAFLAAALTIGHWGQYTGIARPRLFSFFMLPTRLWEFGFGIVAAALQGRSSCMASRPKLMHALQAACALVLVLAFKYGSDLWYVPGFQAVGPCLAAMVLLMTGHSGWVGRAMCWRGMTYLGDRSYSIYLWQGPLLVYAGMLYATPMASVLAALSTIPLSIITYELVEQRFRVSAKGAGGRGAGWLQLFIGVLLLSAASDFIIRPWMRRYAAPAPVRATQLDLSCQRQRGIPGLKPCVYGDAERPKLLLAGDSHAGALSQAVIDAAEGAGWQTHVATASACSIPEYPEAIAYRASCAGFAGNILSYARAQKADLVVISQFSEFYVADLRIGVARWSAGLATFIRSLAEEDIPVLVIGDSPRFPHVMGRPLWKSDWSVDLTGSMSARSNLAIKEREVVPGADEGAYISATDILCDGASCPVFDHGAWLYTDADHLSSRGAALLVKPLSDELRRIKARIPGK